MTSCDAIKEMLVLYIEGALEPEEKRRVGEHLAGCAACSEEAARIGKIREWLADPELFVPAQDMAWQLLPEKLADRARLVSDRKWSRLGLGFPKWTLSAATLLLLAAGLIWTLRLLPPQRSRATPAQAATGNKAFLDRISTLYARAATAQYLYECQDLLVDLISAERSCAADRYDVSLEVTRARQLLQQKRMLDPELLDPDVARAKGLCDELEHLLLDLSTSQECESRGAIQGIERFIEKKQLLLRINLMQSGIS